MEEDRKAVDTTEEEAMGYQKEYRGERDNGKTR
jgi:hypothetical protein